MAGEVKTVGDNLGWFYVLTDYDTIDIEAVKVSDLTGAGVIEGTWAAAASGTRFSFTASETFSDPAYGDSVAVQIPAKDNYEGSIAAFLLKSTAGAFDSASNPLLEAIRVKGTRVLVISGVTGDPTEPRAAGDIYDAFEYVTDNPQKDTEGSGWLKRPVPMLPAGKAAAHCMLVAAGV